MDAVQSIHNHHLFRVRVFCANFSWKYSCIECMVFGECVDASNHEWKQTCDLQKSRAVGGSKYHGPQRAQARNVFDLRCSVFPFLWANTDLLNRCQGKIVFTQFTTLWHNLLQNTFTVALSSCLNLSILSVFGFRSHRLISYFNNVQCVWHSLETRLRSAGEWGLRLASHSLREECAGIPPAHRIERSQKVVTMMAGSLLAIIMMTQGDGAKLFKACSTRTHMGGAPGFFNLIMLWRCQWTNKLFLVLFWSKPTFQWNQLSRPHGPQKLHCLAVPSVCSCFQRRPTSGKQRRSEQRGEDKRVFLLVRLSGSAGSGWNSARWKWHVTCGCKSHKSLKPAQFTGFSLWSLQGA